MHGGVETELRADFVSVANLDGIILCRVPGGARDSENTAKLLVRKIIDET